jgi:hypothetical protein
MSATPDETAPSLASALVRAGRTGSGRRIALSNGTASGLVISSLLTAPIAAEAQQAAKIARIGFQSSASGPTERSESFLLGLRDLGYVEG